MEFTIPQMWAHMGVIAKTVVVILGIQSIYVVAVSIERLIVYVKARKQSRSYALLIKELLESRKYKEASDAALQFKSSHIAKIIRSGLIEFVQGNAAGSSYDSIGAVKRAIEKSGQRQMAYMRRGLAGLATVGSTAPFVGLFGTVFGIINSFQAMPQGGGSLEVVGPGIAEALMTTGAGIGVAVVGVLLFNYFTSQVDALQVDTDESAVEIVDVLIKHAAQPAEASAKAGA
jgi:biopolymer transport protein ExbB/TolQ